MTDVDINEHCSCEQTSHTQTSLTSAANPIAIRAAKCLCWPDHEPQYPMSHLRYWAQPSPPQSFPNTYRDSKQQDSLLCILSNPMPSGLTSIWRACRRSFHLSTPLGLIVFGVYWHVRELWPWGTGWSDEQGKVQVTQTATSKQDKNENCWICCLCMYFGNYCLVNLLELAHQRLGFGYIQREKNPVLASTENMCNFSLQNLYAGHT